MIWSNSVRKRSLDPAILYAWTRVLPGGADAIRHIAQHPYSDSKNQPSNDRDSKNDSWFWRAGPQRRRRTGDKTRLKHWRGLLLRRFHLTQHVAKVIIGAF